jgi:membrane protease YdiL (CAAX protease family)
VLLALFVVALTNWMWLNKVLGIRGIDSRGITLHGSTLALVLTGGFMVLTAPVIEEIFFRGVLYRSLRNNLNIPVAAVIAGAIFALVHGLSYPLDTLPPRFVFGIIASLLYERTGSLLPGIALHCLTDAGGYETAVTGHDQIVFSAFVALGVVLLAYRGVQLLLVPSELPRATMRPFRT